MGLLDLFKRSAPASEESAPKTPASRIPEFRMPSVVGPDRERLRMRFRHLHGVRKRLIDEMERNLPEDVLDEGGRKLGLILGGILVLRVRSDHSMLIDYCVFNCRRGGQNMVERYLAASSAAPDSDEMICLRSMRDAIYSIFVVKSVEHKLGVVVEDALAGDLYFVVNQEAAGYAEPGMVMAARLTVFEEFAIVAGVSVGIADVPEEEAATIAKEFAYLIRSDEYGYRDPAPLLAWYLREQRRREPPVVRPVVSLPDPSRDTDSNRKPRKIGRNEPCPCGSGEKYKYCCINRR